MVVFNSRGFETYKKKMPSRNTEVEIPKTKSSATKTARKKWSLQDSVKGTEYNSSQDQTESKYDQENVLLKLRSHLAKDGCPESQLQVARAFLQMEKTDGNTQHAVHWLLQASMQGNSEATEMLADCLEKNVGITEENFSQIKHCLNLDEQEKLARGAIKQLFYRCCFGSSYITLYKLNTLVHKIYEHGANAADGIQFTDHEISCDSLELKYGSPKISEKELILASKRYSEGFAPEIHLEPPNFSKLEWILDEPIMQTTHLLFSCYDIICERRKTLSITATCCVAFAFMALNSCQLFGIALQAIFLLSYLIILLSIVSLLKLHLEWKQLLLWSTLLKHLSEGLNVEKIESRFQTRHKIHYLSISLAFLVSLCLGSSVSTTTWSLIVSPTLGVLFLHIMKSMNDVKFLSFLTVTSLALSFGLEADYCLTEFIENYTGIESLMIPDKIQIYDYDLKFTVRTCAQLCWFVCILAMILSRGTHLVFFHLAVYPPVYILHHAFVSLKNEKPSEIFLLHWLHSSLCILALFVSFVLMSWMRIKMSSNLRKAFILVGLIALICSRIASTPNNVSSLSWETYQDICHFEDSFNNIQVVERCRLLEGSSVEWEGTVKKIDASASNIMSNIVYLFPLEIQPYMRCLLSWQSEKKIGTEKDFFEVARRHINTCSLAGWDQYRYKITVSIGNPFWKSKRQELIIHAYSSLQELISLLSVNDIIKFEGIFLGHSNSQELQLDIHSLHCINCKNKIPDSVDRLNIDLSHFQSISFFMANFLNKTLNSLKS